MADRMADRIKCLRTEHQLTQEELGKIVGLHKAAINKYEKGNVENMKRSVIAKMSEAFNVSPSYLLAFTDDRTPVRTKVDLLNRKGYEKLINYLDDLLENPQNTVPTIEEHQKNTFKS